MDPITVAALTALAGSVAGDFGHQAWQGLTALVRRPFRRGAAGDGEVVGVSSGELEVAELESDPADPLRAQALATALGVRAALDGEFRASLEEWWRDTQSGTPDAEVHNSISGGTQYGPVIQGRDFSGLTFDTSKDEGH
ncbi:MULTISPECIES: hypothetical protein [unclassified Streptomyces]|uniref:hypothetical protein n=1 Tax=unclassified Streptomyces TaxID=2593676 RepID=UPI001660C0D6|nr:MULTISPECIES: hypothetical protein [unclassified Streptomyces]MBD0709079.1 hypothetical protein [Streptomyces sp. CBMA291]MBD0716229.1 hypothetical protein [Streptomyces sp. CBMA370]